MHLKFIFEHLDALCDYKDLLITFTLGLVPLSVLWQPLKVPRKLRAVIGWLHPRWTVAGFLIGSLALF